MAFGINPVRHAIEEARGERLGEAAAFGAFADEKGAGPREDGGAVGIAGAKSGWEGVIFDLAMGATGKGRRRKEGSSERRESPYPPDAFPVAALKNLQ